MTEHTNIPAAESPNAEEQFFDFRNLLQLLFRHWLWFLVSVFACLVVAYVYLRYQAPVYQATASVLIKEQDPRSKAMVGINGALGTLQNVGGFSMTSSFYNEVEIIRSRSLVRQVVSDLGLYVQTELERPFGYNVPLYRQSPVVVSLTPEEADRLPGTVRLHLRYTPSGHLYARAEYPQETTRQVIEKEFSALPAVWPTPVGAFRFSADSAAIAGWNRENDLNLRTTVNPPARVAAAYLGNLSAEPTSKTTTVVRLAVRNTSPRRGVDFLNRLIAVYNEETNNEKNEVARKSAEFIDERIAIINQELGSTENQLADFKQRSGLTNLTSDAQLALSESSRYEQQRIENATQISLVQFLDNYLNDPKNNNEVIPANVGLKDNNLTSVIDQYNQLIIERNRLLRTSSESNPAVVNLNTGIEAMRASVQTTVRSVLKGLQIAQTDISRQSNKYRSRISAAPQQEKEFVTISRQQEIKAQLYTILLQKREENAITLAATANNGRVIEEASADFTTRVAPRGSLILLAAFLLGLSLPVAFYYLRELLRTRIENRADIERLTRVPLLSELPRCSMPQGHAIVVQENRNDLMEEIFRDLRTNLLFLLEPKEQVILFTSTQPGEGKSFLAANTAVSLALLGKKVILLGLDIRKPGLNRAFGFTRRSQGITNYLSDPEHTDPADLIIRSYISPNLHILPGGPVPPNPTELVSRPSLKTLIETFRTQYDYILLDTAPIGIVTDTDIIARCADLCLYVCRAGVTPKSGFAYINTLSTKPGFPKLATVLNGVDFSKRRYTPGSKYGYGYGYDEQNKKRKS